MQQGPVCRALGFVYVVVFTAIGLEQSILLEHLRVGVFAEEDFLFGPNPVAACFHLEPGCLVLGPLRSPARGKPAHHSKPAHHGEFVDLPLDIFSQ